MALRNGLLSKAKNLISRNYRGLTNPLDIFSQLGQRGEFSHYELRKLAKVLNLSEEVRSRLKALRDFDGEFTELFTLITD